MVWAGRGRQWCGQAGEGSRLVLILLVYVYLFQHYCTGATMKTRLSDVVSV